VGSPAIATRKVASLFVNEWLARIAMAKKYSKLEHTISPNPSRVSDGP
jgi:hypothetical protein